MPKIHHLSSGCQRVTCRAKRLSGFTLIELMMVLVLMAILAALIFPEMKSTLEDERLRSAGRQLVRACHLAASQSVTVGQRHRVLIDPRASRYRVERLSLDQETGAGFQALPDLPESEGRFDRAIEVAIQPAQGMTFAIPDPELPPDMEATIDPWSQEDAIQFFADGQAEPKEIRLRDRHGFALVLRVNPINGRLQFDKPTRTLRP